MKHGKRLNARTVVLNYTDKPPAGKPLTALRWTPGAVDTCGPDAPATQAHTAHTTPPLPVGADVPQRPTRTAQVASAPRPASGPDTSGTAQPEYSPDRHDLGGGHPHRVAAEIDRDLAPAVGGRHSLDLVPPAHPSVEHLDTGDQLGGGDLDALARAGDRGSVGGDGVGRRAHRDIKHHPVTYVNNIRDKS